VQEAWIHYERLGSLAWPISSSYKTLAAIALTFATDALDGFLARRWKQRSKLGALLGQSKG